VREGRLLTGMVSAQYDDWLVKNVYLADIGTMKASEFLGTFVA
jgi:hypothetical protein